MYNRPLAKSNIEFKITNTSDEIESQPKAFSPAAITFGQNLEAFEKTDGVFIGNATA